MAYCPHCGNNAPQKLVHDARHLEKGWSQDGKEENFPWGTFVAVCGTCSQVLVYDNIGGQWEPQQFHYADLVYPRSGHIHYTVPKNIREAYAEAHRIKQLAPGAFAVQIRRALEAVCEDRGANKGTLQVRLKELTDAGELPAALSEAGDAVRLLGNIGAHGIGVSIHPTQALALDELFRAIVEYLYVSPYRLRKIKEQMNALDQEN